MKTLTEASHEEHKRLLNLFPLKVIQDYWPEAAGTKDAILTQAVADRDVAQFTRLIMDRLDCCKQHVYFYETDVEDPLNGLPQLFDAAHLIGRVVDEGRRRVTLYYVRDHEYNVIVRNPAGLQEVTLRFLWPMSFDFRPGAMVAHFVKMSKDVRTYYKDVKTFVAGVSTDERSILEELVLAMDGAARPLDIHKGIKQLLENDVVDASASQVKGARSTRSEAMDEEFTIKKHNREFYDQMMGAPLLRTVLKAQTEELPETAFGVEPGVGRLNIQRQSESPEPLSVLVEMILELNK